MTYSEKLKDPRWQKVRLLVMNRDNWSCVRCKSSDLTLQVHHKRYDKGKEPWEYEYSNFETLCFKCHEKEHDIKPEKSFEAIQQMVVGKFEKREEPEVITSINEQMLSLQEKLKTQVDDDIMVDILKNIMFLQQKKKELLNMK